MYKIKSINKRSIYRKDIKHLRHLKRYRKDKKEDKRECTAKIFVIYTIASKATWY